MKNSLWAIYGHRGRHKTGPVGRDGLHRLDAQGRMVDVEGYCGDNNTRLAHCKVCGVALPAGTGHCFVIFSLNGYNSSTYYACDGDYAWMRDGMRGGTAWSGS